MVSRVLLSESQFRISKPGVDVLTTSEADPDNFLLKEGTQNLGVFLTGNATLLANPGNGTTEYVGQELMYPYDLGYVPLVMAHWLLLPNEAFVSSANSESYRYVVPEDPTIDRGFFVWAFRDRLRMQKRGNSSLKNVQIRYTVYFAKASDA